MAVGATSFDLWDRLAPGVVMNASAIKAPVLAHERTTCSTCSAHQVVASVAAYAAHRYLHTMPAPEPSSQHCHRAHRLHTQTLSGIRAAPSRQFCIGRRTYSRQRGRKCACTTEYPLSYHVRNLAVDVCLYNISRLCRFAVIVLDLLDDDVDCRRHDSRPCE